LLIGSRVVAGKLPTAYPQISQIPQIGIEKMKLVAETLNLLRSSARRAGRSGRLRRYRVPS
ncbi:MAG TPA: hypothetical protein VGC20_08010, partial [bacterium]